jgi:hypothetical protein
VRGRLPEILEYFVKFKPQTPLREINPADGGHMIYKEEISTAWPF